MMMHKEHYTNGHSHRTRKISAPQPSTTSRSGGEFNSASIPIPTQKNNLRRQSTNESDDSVDSNAETLVVPDHSPITAFSRSLSGSHANSVNPLNVYSMSPRSTSVMYQYYSTPKGYYQSQVPLLHSKTNGYYHTDENASTRMRHRSLVRTSSECCSSPPNNAPVLSGIPQILQNDVQEDPRRRAWSESDSHKKSNMHMSRMSALKKLRKKLGRSGSLKKKRSEETTMNETLNHSVASVNSLEKVEEGRQLLCSKTSSPSSSKRSTMHDDGTTDFCALHQEDETVKVNEPSCDTSTNNNASRERVRSPSSESVFNPEAELIYQRFLEEHTCYDVMPTSCKLVVFDTNLQARKAFHALIANAVRSAPLWDSAVCCYVGMLTVTDFIKVILKSHRSKHMRVESVEEQTIASWRKLLNQKSSFANVHPGDTLLHSLKILIMEHFHGVPILDEESGDIFYTINHKRILRFLHLFMNELPMPSFMKKTLGEVKIGTYEDVATVTKHHTMLDVLELIVERKVTAVPVLDEQGEVMDVFCKLDMIALAAQGLYHDLSMTMEIALAYRFTPLFEDEECPADTFTRFSSPKPERREMTVRSDHVTVGKANTSLTTYLNEYRSNKNEPKSGNSSIKGHSVIRPKPQTSPISPRTPAKEARGVQSTSRTHQPIITSEGVTSSECNSHHRVRHKSLSNPLVKCRLSDKLQHVIDLMVTTDANLLVVIGQNSNHVIGVITVSDVLCFIVNPPGHGAGQTSPAHIHKRKSRLRFSSLSSGSSLPSVQDGPESSTDGAVGTPDEVSSLFAEEACDSGRLRNGRPGSKISTSSDVSAHTFNDSGYTSASSNLRKDSNLIEPGSNPAEVARPRAGSNRSEIDRINARFLRMGAEMERA